MTGLLCSVTTEQEALIALEHGADIIDLKNPSAGALGALPLELVRQITQRVAGRRPVSATIGDLPMQASLVLQAVDTMAATGVDLVKIGFFGAAGHAECIRALAPTAARGVRLVAVLFADGEPDFSLLPLLAQSGFHGVMLDTASKNGRRLRHSLDEATLRDFVVAARSLGLLVGLAGSLAADDIPELVRIDPDYLGFRGALCRDANRKQALDSDRMRQIREMLHSCNMGAGEYA